jgi:hypothetical protein
MVAAFAHMARGLLECALADGPAPAFQLSLGEGFHVLRWNIDKRFLKPVVCVLKFESVSHVRVSVCVPFRYSQYASKRLRKC